MIPLWSFLLWVVAFTAVGYVTGLRMGRYFEWKDRNKKDLQFKREALRPKPRATQSVDALAEEERPAARVSRGKIYPRRGRKTSN
jgi:hypothetical protein